MRRTLFALTIAALTLPACRTPVGVRDTGFEPVYRSFRANVLDVGIPSAQTFETLAYFGLDDRYANEPAAVIAELERINVRERARRLQVPIAELSYYLALREFDRARFLASAIHAYLYLFDEEFSDPPNPYSRDFRLACDLYNRGLARAMRDPSGAVVLGEGEIEIPTGTIAIQSTRPGFPWGEEVFSTFLPADVFEVRGLRERVRDAGLGVPLIAVQSGGTSLGITAERVSREIKLPATAFLHVHGGLTELMDGDLTATLELYLGTDVPTVDLGEQRVPLESDITAPLAYTLEESRIWGFGLAGFRGKSKDYDTGVFMLQPYQEGKIPLLLIHGTASSPATWAQMVNGILADRRIRGRYQVWMALYDTGNPIAYSASLVREALEDIYAELDPEHDDPALSDMVIVGHSQGGLLTRLLVSESGDRIWNSIVDEPFDTYPMEPETRELLQQTVFFEPVPFARRAVFISTPHRGSFFASSWIGRLSNRLINLPGDLTDRAAGLFENEAFPEELREIPTSVDNMDPDNRFVRTLGTLPFGEELHLHSIIAVKPTWENPEEGNDGVVAYSSAHLEGVDSELIVRYGHSCQNQPETIGELRRILLKHLE